MGGGAIATALVLLGQGVALAQYGPPPPPPPYQQQPPPPPPYYPPPPEPEPVRDGVVIGASIGLGGISESSCAGCETLGGLALQVQLGGMLTPQLALVGDASIILHGDDVRTVSHGVLAVAAQWWVLEKVWLKGGLGVGRVTSETQVGPEQVRTEDGGTGVLLAGGIEFLNAESFVLDVQLRLAAIRYSYDAGDERRTLLNTSVQLGFNWY